MSDRVFLDANVLFSAAWSADAGLARLWKIKDVVLVSSRYALAEAGRNLDTAAQKARLAKLADDLSFVESSAEAALPRGVELVAKDAPILLAAIEAHATHLLTGDRRHFNHLYGKSVEGVKILAPADYLKNKRPNLQ